MKIKHGKDFNPREVKPDAEKWVMSVKLYDEDDDSTRTRFYFNGVLKGTGIEDEYREVKVKGETRVANGWYKLGMRISPKFSGSYYRDDDGNIIQSGKRTTEALKTKYHTKHELIWVLDVDYFQYVLIHWGNTDDDTDGCYVVGTGFGIIGGQKAVTASRKKYEEIYPELWRAVKAGNAWIHYDR